MSHGADLGEAFKDCFQISLLADFLNHPTFEKILLISCYLGVFIAVASLLIEMTQIVLKGEGSYFDIILKIFIAIFLLTSFSSWAIGIVEFSDSFAQDFLDSSLLSEYSEYAGEKSGYESYLQYSDTYTNMKLRHFIIGNDPQCIEKILVKISVWITKAVMFIIGIIRNVSLTALLLLGPLLVITIPNKYLSPYGWGWVKSYLNIVSWPLVVALMILVLNITLDKFLMASDDTLLMIKLFSYNIVFILMLMKAMSFLPSLKQGTAGALSAIEGLMGAGMAAAGLSGAKKLAAGVNNMASSNISNGLKDAKTIAKAGIAGFANSASDSIDQSRVPSVNSPSSEKQTANLNGNSIAGGSNETSENSRLDFSVLANNNGSLQGTIRPDNESTDLTNDDQAMAGVPNSNKNTMPIGFVPDVGNLGQAKKNSHDQVIDNSHAPLDNKELLPNEEITNRTPTLDSKEKLKIFKTALSDGLSSMKAETEKKYPTTYAMAKLGKRIVFK